MPSRVSIIIPAKNIDENLKECIGHCIELNYPDFEILVLLDNEVEARFPKTKIIVTGQVPPSHKRDIGAKHATGEFLAFIDADAYPSRNWLLEAIKNFEKEGVVAVGGPAVTAEGDTLLQKASGFVYSSFLVGGTYRYRYIPEEKREVSDCQTCNFVIRKRVFHELGGFKVDFWPGEDTKLGLKLEKIVYDPKVLVYHHRRKLFIPHLKQIWGYATTPFIVTGKNPLKILHLIPSLFILGLTAGMILFLMGHIRLIFISSVCIYLALVLISSVHSCGKSNLKAVPLVFIGTILTYVVYGAGVIGYLVTARWKRWKNES